MMSQKVEVAVVTPTEQQKEGETCGSVGLNVVRVILNEQVSETGQSDILTG